MELAGMVKLRMSVWWNRSIARPHRNSELKIWLTIRRWVIIGVACNNGTFLSLSVGKSSLQIFPSCDSRSMGLFFLQHVFSCEYPYSTKFSYMCFTWHVTSIQGDSFPAFGIMPPHHTASFKSYFVVGVKCTACPS